MTPKSDILLLYAARALRGFGDGFAIIILPAYLTAIGFSPAQIGVVASASLFGTALLTLAIGLIAPRHDLRNLLLGGALLMAITMSDPKMARLLLHLGAKVNGRKGDRYTPLEEARQNGFEEIEKILLGAGGTGCPTIEVRRLRREAIRARTAEAQAEAKAQEETAGVVPLDPDDVPIIEAAVEGLLASFEASRPPIKRSDDARMYLFDRSSQTYGYQESQMNFELDDAISVH